jgi:hypothetical protein
MNTVAAARTASTAPTSNVSAVSFTPPVALLSRHGHLLIGLREPRQLSATGRIGEAIGQRSAFLSAGLPALRYSESAQPRRAWFASAGIILCGSNPTRGAVCQTKLAILLT